MSVIDACADAAGRVGRACYRFEMRKFADRENVADVLYISIEWS